MDEQHQGGPRTREECIASAGRTLAQAIAKQNARTPREAAEAAHQRGGPSVAELERRIRTRRGLPPSPSAPVARPVSEPLPPASTVNVPMVDTLTACPGPHHRLVYSVDQAAEQLSISTTVLWELIRAGDVPTITYAEGRRRRGITHVALLRWIAGREAAAEVSAGR